MIMMFRGFGSLLLPTVVRVSKTPCWTLHWTLLLSAGGRHHRDCDDDHDCDCDHACDDDDCDYDDHHDHDCDYDHDCDDYDHCDDDHDRNCDDDATDLL